MSNKYNIAIVDDHEIFRNGLKLLLNKIENIEIVAEASNGQKFLDILENCKPDLVFMDISMPVMDGIITTKKALEKYPDLKIITLTTFDDTEYLDEMLYAGVEGFMLKNSKIENFKKAIEKVISGGNYFSEEVLAKLTRNFVLRHAKEKIKKDLPEFSQREVEVLKLICKGLSNIRIGELLFISDRTVERHKASLLAKTNTSNTVNLVIYALKNKLATN